PFHRASQRLAGAGGGAAIVEAEVAIVEIGSDAGRLVGAAAGDRRVGECRIAPQGEVGMGDGAAETDRPVVGRPIARRPRRVIIGEVLPFPALFAAVEERRARGQSEALALVAGAPAAGDGADVAGGGPV